MSQSAILASRNLSTVQQKAIGYMTSAKEARAELQAAPLSTATVGTLWNQGGSVASGAINAIQQRFAKGTPDGIAGLILAVPVGGIGWYMNSHEAVQVANGLASRFSNWLGEKAVSIALEKVLPNPTP